MKLSRDQERELLLTVRRSPEDHVVFPWRAYERDDGSLLVYRNNTQERLPRYLYRLVVDPQLERQRIERICDEVRCVNPWHYEQTRGSISGSSRARRYVEHKPDGGDINAAKTECPQGHPYAGENLSFDGKKRRCKTCQRERARARRKASLSASA